MSLVQWQLLVDIESIKRDQFLTSLMNEDDQCRNIVEAGLFYHQLSDEELVCYWENLSKTSQKPSRWPKMLVGLCYADSLIESYDFEDGKWSLLTERIGCYSYGSELCYVPASGKLYVIGGVQSKDVDSYCVEVRYIEYQNRLMKNKMKWLALLIQLNLHFSLFCRKILGSTKPK